MVHRRVLTLAVLCVIMVSACAPTQTTTQVASPCNDAQYLELKKKQLSELSEREYQYMQDKDKACDEYNRTAMQMQQTKDMTNEATNRWLTWYLIAAGIGVVGSIIMLSSI